MLFLDEPTTGLASAAAYSVVGYIAKLVAQTKVVCIMTIHQVSSRGLHYWLWEKRGGGGKNYQKKTRALEKKKQVNVVDNQNKLLSTIKI